MNNSKFVLHCSNLAKQFQDGKNFVDVFSKINLTIHRGEQIAIIGTSGAGKSTLLHLLGGLEQPSLGKVFIEGQDIHQLNEKERSKLRNRTLGFVYQFHHLLPEFTVLENVAMPLLIRKIDISTATQQAIEILEKVGLGKRINHRIGELSGGERQRTAIARALVTKPRCILADEPTGNLDYKTSQKVYDLMLELNQDLSTSAIIVTHDHKLAAKMDTVYQLESGALNSIHLALV